jgi:hypothetical protein
MMILVTLSRLVVAVVVILFPTRAWAWTCTSFASRTRTSTKIRAAEAATLPPTVPITSREEDLQRTITIIRQHWAQQQQQQQQNTEENDDTTQRALFTQTLYYQRKDVQRRQAQRKEAGQRKLLKTQLQFQQYNIQQQKERNQRKLLQATLQQFQNSKTTTSSITTSSKSSSLPSSSVHPQKRKEAQQRALLQAQLTYSSSPKTTRQSTITTTDVSTPTQLRVSPPPPSIERIRQGLLSENDNYKDMLIRIACATCPSEAVFPQHVTQVDILSFSTTTPTTDTENDTDGETTRYSTLEVAILVCDPQHNDCVNVAVPITLSFEACTNTSINNSVTSDDSTWWNTIMQQLQQLDQQALQTLQQAEQKLYEKEKAQDPSSYLHPHSSTTTSTSTQQQALLQEAPVFRFGGDVPDWWTTGDVEIQRECDSLKQILNEQEFRKDICTLVQRQLGVPTRPGDDEGNSNAPQEAVEVVVVDAAVALVGSSGLFLRALVRPSQNDTNADKVRNNSNNSMVSVGIPFPQGKVAVREDLQAAVLDMVEGV